MKIEKFWDSAFIAALNRLPVDDAKKEADLATQVCIEHWQANRGNLAIPGYKLWQNQGIADVPLSGFNEDGTPVKIPPSPNKILARERAAQKGTQGRTDEQ